MKKGFTLIELVVAMGIFTVLSTLVIGAYVSVSHMKTLSSSMRESQQKIRTATEKITRLSRQASGAEIDNTAKKLTLYFSDPTDPTKNKIVKFELEPITNIGTESGALNQKDCIAVTVSGGTMSCTSDIWSSPINLLGNKTKLKDANLNKFVTDNNRPTPVLSVVLSGKIGEASSSPFYSDSFSLNTSVPLENLK